MGGWGERKGREVVLGGVEQEPAVAGKVFAQGPVENGAVGELAFDERLVGGNDDGVRMGLRRRERRFGGEGG